MSGLLRRLARQTIGGEPPAIRPLSRLPWVAPLELAEDATTEHGSPAPQRTAYTRPTAELNRVQPSEALADRSPRDNALPEPLARPTSRDPSRTTEVVGALETGTPPSRLETTEADNATDAPTDPAHTPDDPMVASRAPRPHRPPEQPVAPGPEGPQPASRTEVTSLHLPAPLVEATVLPARDQAPAAPWIEPESRGDAARASVHEPAEVHVHIGRIEVTAVHEAPPTREEKRAARQPMSLEAYLAKRHGRTG